MGRETEEGKAKEKNVMYSQRERERVERRKSKKEREMLNRDSDTYIHTYMDRQIQRDGEKEMFRKGRHEVKSIRSREAECDREKSFQFLVD